jgi:CO/xanthine dehydrogenase Mo-binding subunit
MTARYTESAARVVEPPSETKRKASGSGQVKRSVRRLEGKAKVDGSAEYIYNLSLPGMLYGKIARSSIAHGKILSIDVMAALAVEGVHAVITGEDIRR